MNGKMGAWHGNSRPQKVILGHRVLRSEALKVNMEKLIKHKDT